MTAIGLEIVTLLIKSDLAPNFCFSDTIYFFPKLFNIDILLLILEMTALGGSDKTCPML